jgi:hypothetical protein
LGLAAPESSWRRRCPRRRPLQAGTQILRVIWWSALDQLRTGCSCPLVLVSTMYSMWSSCGSMKGQLLHRCRHFLQLCAARWSLNLIKSCVHGQPVLHGSCWCNGQIARLLKLPGRAWSSSRKLILNFSLRTSCFKWGGDVMDQYFGRQYGLRKRKAAQANGP